MLSVVPAGPGFRLRAWTPARRAPQPELTRKSLFNLT
jgi:hypothetical protein